MTSEDLIKEFGLPFEGFTNFTPWVDAVGFSVLKEKNNGFASLYKIGFIADNDDNTLKKLWITANYGRKLDDGGITLRTETRLMDPVDLDSYKEFFFDSSSKKFFYNKKEINPKDILKKLEYSHLKTTKNFEGLPLRLKLIFWRKFLPLLVNFLDKSFIFLLELFTGEVVEDRDIVKRFVNQIHDENNKRPTIESDISLNREIKTPRMWSFLGFTATKWSVVFYSVVNIFLYLFNSIVWKINNPIVINIFKNNFLTLCYVAVSFSFLEELIPELLRILIRKMPEIYRYVAFKRLRISI